jgi:RNA polymerase sigma-70 factor (ECF subfamily)
MATENDGADEEWLLERCRQGDRRAFVDLTYNHLQGVYSIALNLSSSEGDAVRLTQSALRLTWRRIASMPADLPFRILVRRTVVGLAIEKLRSNPPLAAKSLEGFLPSFDRDGCLVVAANESAGLDPLRDRPDIAQRIREALGHIDVSDRAAFVLRHIEQLSLGDTAAILELPAEKVQKGSHRACSMLSGYLRELASQP